MDFSFTISGKEIVPGINLLSMFGSLLVTYLLIRPVIKAKNSAGVNNHQFLLNATGSLCAVVTLLGSDIYLEPMTLQSGTFLASSVIFVITAIGAWAVLYYYHQPPDPSSSYAILNSRNAMHYTMGAFLAFSASLFVYLYVQTTLKTYIYVSEVVGGIGIFVSVISWVFQPFVSMFSRHYRNLSRIGLIIHVFSLIFLSGMQIINLAPIYLIAMNSLPIGFPLFALIVVQLRYWFGKPIVEEPLKEIDQEMQYVQHGNLMMSEDENAIELGPIPPSPRLSNLAVAVNLE